MSEIITHKSINQERSQLINRALVADLLRQEGVCSRATLAQLSGLKQATITISSGNSSSAASLWKPG